MGHKSYYYAVLSNDCSMTDTTEAENWFQNSMAKALYKDKPYIIVCHDCAYAWGYDRDCKTTKGARNGTRVCGDCGSELTLVKDAKE